MKTLARICFSLLLLGFFSSLLSAQDSSETAGAELPPLRDAPPLYIPECDSPHETMSSFTELSGNIRDVFLETKDLDDIQWEQESKLIDLYAKLTYLLDTSHIPENDQFAQANIIASQISEILDRLETPHLDQIPDESEMPADVNYWRFPNMELALTRIQDGPRKGDWVFSSEVVSKADDYYDRVKHMPYLDDAVVGDIDSKGGILDHYIDYTGPLIPIEITDRIPDWMRAKFFGDPLWKYFATVIILVLLVGVGLLVRLVTRFRRDKIENPNHILLQLRRILLPLTMVVLLPMVIHVITIDIRLRLLPLEITDDILWFIFYLMCFWLCVCISSLVSAIIIASPSISPFGLDASLVRLGSRLVAYGIGFWILVEGLQNLGLSLVPLIAGVSVGGLAFALAARPTLGNILGGVLIFADKPFRVGERVVVNNHDGTVEEIGLRSTRIRTLDGHLLSVPNEEVSGSFVENIGARPYVKRTLNVTVTYDTSPEKIEEAMSIIKQLLSTEEDGEKSKDELGRPANSMINTEAFPPRVYFNDLNADSLNILVIYWFSPPNYFDYLEHATWFNLELLKRFNAAGIDFAFPTQTIELKQVGGVVASPAQGETTSEPSPPGQTPDQVKR